MTTPISVSIGGARRLDHAIAIASLPADLRPSNEGAAEVEVTKADFASVQAALAGPAAAVVIDDITALDRRTIALLEAAKVPIHPALFLASSLSGIDADATVVQAGLVRSRLAWGGPLETALLEHLAGLTVVLGPLTEVALLCQAATHYLGRARTEQGVDVLWSGQAEAIMPSYELDIIGLDQRLDVSGALDGSARPLAVRQGNLEGLLQLQGVFETGMRRFWRSVVADRRGAGRAPVWGEVAPLLYLVRNLNAGSSFGQRGAT